MQSILRDWKDLDVKDPLERAAYNLGHTIEVHANNLKAVGAEPLLVHFSQVVQEYAKLIEQIFNADLNATFVPDLSVLEERALEEAEGVESGLRMVQEFKDHLDRIEDSLKREWYEEDYEV